MDDADTSDMNWKYTAIGTGVTALATLLATGPARYPDRGMTRPPAAAGSSPAVDVQQEAERLEARLRHLTRYEEPSRNLFRFEAKPASEVPPPAAGAPEEPPAPPAEAPAQPLPALTLIGAVFDGPDVSKPVTAILSTPSGVLLVREGDLIGSDLRVTTLDAEGVTVESTAGAPSFTIRFPSSR